MDSTIIERATIDARDLPSDPAQREAVLRVYRARLAHLLAMTPGDSPDLAADEQRRLRSRAVLTTVRALTAFGEGALASDLLRQAEQARVARA
jgi:hypothetical protein